MAEKRVVGHGYKRQFRGRERRIIFSALKYGERNWRRHPCVCLPSESSKVPSSTINDLSPCPSPLIPIVGVRATRGNGHASSGAQKATFATPTCRHKHVDTIRFEHCPSENQRGQSVVAGRAPMRRFVQQSLPFSTSTRFVNSLVIELSAWPRALLLKQSSIKSVQRPSIRFTILFSSLETELTSSASFLERCTRNRAYWTIDRRSLDRPRRGSERIDLKIKKLRIVMDTWNVMRRDS